MIGRIFKKEMVDTLRDKRTLMTMIFIPVLIFPIIISLFMNISASFQEEAQNKELKIGYLSEGNDPIVRSTFESLPDSVAKFELITFADSSEMKTLVQEDSLQLAIFIPSDFETNVSGTSTGNVKIFYNATKVGNDDRAEAYFSMVKEIMLTQRLQELNIDRAAVTPLNVDYENVASDKEVIGKLAGGILPYIFIAFGFIGCMYPAIDLFTGEKERGTIETLLTTPVARWKILFGKMGVVICSGLAAASFALFGLYLSLEVFNLVEDPRLLEVINDILSLKFIFMLYLLLIPLTVFFAGIMIPIAVYAKSFKEAQSIITPLNIVIVLPAMVGFFPGIELNAVTACIPVINVVLATKELIAETLNPGLLALSFTVMMALAVISVFISYKRFDKESNVVL